MLQPFFDPDHVEAGCDEAGRGCLAGPVFASAVILPKKFSLSLLNDSKLLSEKQREQLRPVIEKEALAWSVAMVDNIQIDQINILNASFLAMHKALDKLKKRPELLLIDGNRFKPYAETPHYCIVKGDQKYLSIAAASVLAKTYRDEYMMKLHDEYPMYNWKQNKAYATQAHKEAIKQYGYTSYHRMSFRLTSKQLVFPF